MLKTPHINKSTSLVENIKSFFGPKKIPIDPTYTTPDGQEGWFYETFGGGNQSYFKYENHDSCVTAYNRCPVIPAIMNRKANCLVNGKVWVLDKDGAVVDTKDKQAEKLYKFFRRPNPHQNWRDFEAQLYIYMQLFGFALILPTRPIGFTDPLDASAFWNIPINWIDIKSTVEKFNANGGFGIEEIDVTYNGTKVTFQMKDLIMIRDFVPSFSSSNSITFPGSKLRALGLPINNIIGAYESRGMLINYRGALGILSSDPGSGQFQPVALTPEKQRGLQNDFRKYGLKRDQFQVIITSAQLKWQPMGYPTRELMLLEEVEDSTRDICANLNFPVFILGFADTTYNNMNAAEKGLYQNAVIPDSNVIYDQLNNWFQLERFGWKIDKDFSHIDVLQDDKEAQARARLVLAQSLNLEWTSGWIKLNRLLELMGEDTIDGGDVYYADWVKATVADPNVSDEIKMLIVSQGRNNNGQFTTLSGRYNSISPNGIDYGKEHKVN